MRAVPHFAAGLAVALLLAPSALLVQGCGGGGSDRPGATPNPALTGVVFDYTDQAARDVPVRVLGGPNGRTGINGLFGVGPVSPGPGVLVVGDSITTPTLVVPFVGTAEGSFLERPLFLPSLESGLTASLPGSVAAVTTISGDELPGVSLRLGAGTSVNTLSGGSGAEVRVVPVSPSRLPTPVAGGNDGRGEPKAAFLVEPHGVTFSPDVVLRVPRQDDLALGPFDAYKLERTTGRWVRYASGLVPDADGFELPVSDGTLYAVVPRTLPAPVTISGRVVASTQPVAGFRVSCWNRVSDPTTSDGTFEIRDLPAHFATNLLRVSPARPGVDFAPEVRVSTSPNAIVGDLQVEARPPDRIRPTVRSTTPTRDQVNVDRRTQVVVVFSEAIDPKQSEPFELIGLNGQVAGEYSFDNPFTVRFRPRQTLDPSERYTILVDRRTQDLAGNQLEDDAISFRFTTRGGAPDPAPTDTLAFGVVPLSGARGDLVTVPGRNYTGGTSAVFGSTEALVQSETPDAVTAVVPDFQPAGPVTVSLSAGGVGISTLKPLVFDLRATVAVIYSGNDGRTPLAVLDRADPPAFVIVDGHNVGNTRVSVDGVDVAAVDSQVTVGGVNVSTGRTLNLPTPAPSTLLSGPVVLHGANGEPSTTYRFLLVRD